MPRPRIVTAVALIGLVLTGCGSGGSHGTTASSRPPVDSTVSGTTATSSASASAAIPEETAAKQALALVSAYFAAVDRVASDPAVPLESLRAVATSPQFDIAVKDYGSNRARGYRQTGNAKIVTSHVVQVDPASDPTKALADYPSVRVVACIDASPVYVTDATGKRIATEGRPNYFIEQLTIIDHSYPDAAGWRVSDISSHGVTSCSGA